MSSSDFAFDKHVIHIKLHVLSILAVKNFVVQVLVRVTYIFQIEQHGPITKQPLIIIKTIFFSSSRAI